MSSKNSTLPMNKEDAALVDDTSAQKDPADDILLTESGNILLDAIQLNRRVAASN